MAILKSNVKKAGYKRAGAKHNVNGKPVYVKKVANPKPKTTAPKVTGPAAPAAPVDPLAIYNDIPGARSTLTRLDAQRDHEIAYSAQIQKALADQITPLANANASAQQAYAGLAGGYASMGAMPGGIPNIAMPGGGAVTPGAGVTAMRQQQFLGQGVAGAGTQAASYGGFMAETGGRTLAQGILGQLTENAARIPGLHNAVKNEYLSKLDGILLETAQAAAEMQQEQALEMSRQETDRYKARLGLVGNLTGTQAKLALGELDSQDAAADRQTRASIADQTNQTRAQVAQTQAQSRERIANLTNGTKRAIAREKAALEVFKAKAKRKGATQKDKVALLRSVQDAFDKLWTGEEGDQITGAQGYGWRFTARAGSGGRQKAAAQVVAWLQTTGLGPQQIHKMFRSKGFTDAEFQKAVRQIESGRGI